MIPYTYYLFHIPTNQHYYGVQFNNNADPKDLWVKYFSSSKRVKKLIEEYGSESFKVEIRKTFNSSKEAINWERRVLSKLNAKNRKDWLNCTNAEMQYVNKGGYKLTDEQIIRRKGKRPWNVGVPMPDYVKEIVHGARRGKSSWNKGIARPEHLKKLQAKLMSGKNNPMYGKSAIIGRRWFNDGIKSVLIFPEDALPHYKRGRLKRTNG